MAILSRAVRRLALVLPLAFVAQQPLLAQAPAEPTPKHLTEEGETPWIYEGSDVPRDEEWTFGELPNGLRYAVRKNGVPPDQVSIRVRIDAGSLHEEDSEQGYAHLLEHLLFRESQYLGPAMAIPTWQRLGATFGSDTNAETSPTHTVYKLDLPNVNEAKLAESMKILSGMVRAPVLSDANVQAEVPIVLAEKRERGGPQQRAAEQTRETLFAGQKLANRLPIGTEATLNAATGTSVSAFYDRWYRPENTVIVAVGDLDPMQLAAEIEKWFGDWQGEGASVAAPDFGDPVAPAGADADNPVGEVSAIVAPGLQRSFTYAVMRPWRPVQDTIVYNEGLLRDSLAQALINRRLEARARAGGKYLYAQVQQDDVSRSTDATFVSFAPLSDDWEGALADVRAVIADALANPPTQEEIDRELAEFESIFASSVEQRRVMAGARLADDIVNAVDIRETVAAPETVLMVFNSMREKVTPEQMLEQTRKLFDGAVIRAAYVTPQTGEASDAEIRTAMLAPVEAAADARIAAQDISFADLPAIGEPGTIERQGPLGVLDIERVDFANGVKAILWANDAEPGRVAVKVRFGGGWRAIEEEDGAYAMLGRMALVGSGLGELGQEELDRISTGRRMGFDFDIADGAFTLFAQTRGQDLADQLYLFAAKLAMPRWDPNPVLRAQAAARLAYESYGANPAGVINRDLEYLLRGRDGRFEIADPAAIDATTPEGFRQVWEPLLKQGPVEVLVFGDFDRQQGIEALAKTFGALEPRDPLPADVAASGFTFPEPGETVVRYHRGDANQAAAVIAWPSGAGVDGLPESRQLEILTQVFNNRLMDAMRERAGASYAPVINSQWPTDVESGGRITAFAQLRPEDVPAFFAAADQIASDLATQPPSADELQRVTEPLLQYVNRVSTGNLFWLFQLEGSTQDPARIGLLRSLLNDLTQTTPERMQLLAQKYFGDTRGWRMAVIPEGQELATRVTTAPAEAAR
ncbi:insulinase family protein [Qipengyuania sp. XHP0207]|uniref:M16 family metallopeptidase n=1 Tax=Qipengyuania sp. XHP0207 TaxID=3038078 RepID=UPI00241D6480|nr:insulinase family protein [Qipengyuania sp. XHP0207]MDG5747099.1 insulinase family protein [Qipengyuania sp. XHP0207]